MDNDSQDFIEALKYWSADRTKALQTKLTKTANSIENDGLSVQLSKILTDDEQATLRKAATILRSVKNKVEHAKEIKQREEARRKAEWERRQKLILDRCHDLFLDPKSPADGRVLLMWRLACGEYWRSYFKDSDYYPRNSRVQEQLDDWNQQRWRDDCHGKHIIGVARGWRRELIECLKDKIQWWPEDPNQAPVEELEKVFNERWKPGIQQTYIALLDRYDTEVAMVGNDKVTRLT